MKLYSANVSILSKIALAYIESIYHKQRVEYKLGDKEAAECSEMSLCTSEVESKMSSKILIRIHWGKQLVIKC